MNKNVKTIVFLLLMGIALTGASQRVEAGSLACGGTVEFDKPNANIICKSHEVCPSGWTGNTVEDIHGTCHKECHCPDPWGMGCVGYCQSSQGPFFACVCN